MVRPTLYIFAGLPASGKSTIAKQFANRMSAAYLRIDTIEQALRSLCNIQVEGEGYQLAYQLAADNLRIGNNVVADSCNAISLTREAWQSVAEQQLVTYINIEILCSDPWEHQQRVAERKSEVAGLLLPAWQQIADREYDEWTSERIQIDTAGKTVEACLNELLEKVEAKGRA
jgi:predicted kinase